MVSHPIYAKWNIRRCQRTGDLIPGVDLALGSGLYVGHTQDEQIPCRAAFTSEPIDLESVRPAATLGIHTARDAGDGIGSVDVGGQEAGKGQNREKNHGRNE